MEVLTYASYREHFKLYPEIQDSVAINKTIILLSNYYYQKILPPPRK